MQGFSTFFNHYTPKKIYILHTPYYAFFSNEAWGSGSRVACQVSLQKIKFYPKFERKCEMILTVSLGPVIVATHLNKFSPSGKAETDLSAHI